MMSIYQKGTLESLRLLCPEMSCVAMGDSGCGRGLGIKEAECARMREKKKEDTDHYS
jgi:hypothetical protein